MFQQLVWETCPWCGAPLEHASIGDPQTRLLLDKVEAAGGHFRGVMGTEEYYHWPTPEQRANPSAPLEPLFCLLQQRQEV